MLLGLTIDACSHVESTSSTTQPGEDASAEMGSATQAMAALFAETTSSSSRATVWCVQFMPRSTPKTEGASVTKTAAQSAADAFEDVRLMKSSTLKPTPADASQDLVDWLQGNVEFVQVG